MKPSYLNINLAVLKDCGKSAAIVQAYLFLFKDFLTPFAGNSSKMGELLGMHRETYREALITLKEHGYVERDEEGFITLTSKSVISKSIPLEGKLYSPAYIMANIEHIESLGIYQACFLGLVAFHTGNGGNFFYKNSTLANAFGVSIKTISRLIAELESKGLIKVTRITKNEKTVVRYITLTNSTVTKLSKVNKDSDAFKAATNPVNTTPASDETQESPSTQDTTSSTQESPNFGTYRVFSSYQHTPVKLPQKKEPAEYVETKIADLQIHQVLTPLHRVGALRMPEGHNVFSLITSFKKQFEIYWASVIKPDVVIKHEKGESWVKGATREQIREFADIAEGILKVLTGGD